MGDATTGSCHGLKDEALGFGFLGISHANPISLGDCFDHGWMLH